MKVLKYPFTILIPLMVVGVIVSFYSIFPLLWIIISFGIVTLFSFLLIIFWREKTHHLVKYCVLLSSLLVGIFIGEWHSKQYQAKNYSTTKAYDLTIQITQKLRDNKSFYRYYGILNQQGESNTPKILLSIFKENNKIAPRLGDEFSINQNLEPFGNATNVGDFNYQSYLATLGIHHQLTIFDEIELHSPNNRFTFSESLLRIKQSWTEKVLASRLSQAAKELVITLLFGNKSMMDKLTLNNYAQAGIIHILAISGLHIGILSLLLAFLFSPLRLLPKGDSIQTALIICTLWTYALFIGESVSVYRAVTLFSLISIGKYIRNTPPPLYWFFLSLGLLVCWNPLYLKQVGFQLSFLAVFGILVIQPKLVNLWKPNNFILKKLWSLISVTLAAQLILTPLTLFYFHQFPGLFLISNTVVLLFIAPFLFCCILFLCILLINIEFLNPFLQITENLISILVFNLNQFVFWIASKKHFILTDVHFSLTQLLLIYLVFALLLIQLYVPKKRIWIVLFIAILGWQTSYYFEKKNKISTEGLWLMNEYKKTTLINKSSMAMKIYTSDHESKKTKTIASFNAYFGIKKHYIKPLPQLIWMNTSLLVLIKKRKKYSYEIPYDAQVLLTNNTSINLSKLLKENCITQIIVDGSSFSNVKEKWKKTCSDYGIPFYDTSKSGFLKIE